MAFPLVNITMVTYNRLALTQKSVASVLEKTHGHYQLTIVDNASTDGTRGYLEALQGSHAHVAVKLLPENMGVAVAANFGWSMQRSPYYVKLDNDVEILNAEWLTSLIAAVENDATIGQAGHRLLEKLSVEEDRLANGRPFYTAACCNGACVLIPAYIHKQFGFWNEDYGLYGYEDLDYSNRLTQHGFRVGYTSLEGYAVHHGYVQETRSEEIETAKQLNITSKRYGEQLYVLNKFLFDNNIRPVYVSRKHMPHFTENGDIIFSINKKYASITALLEMYYDKISYTADDKNIYINISLLK